MYLYSQLSLNICTIAGPVQPKLWHSSNICETRQKCPHYSKIPVLGYVNHGMYIYGHAHIISTHGSDTSAVSNQNDNQINFVWNGMD